MHSTYWWIQGEGVWWAISHSFWSWWFVRSYPSQLAPSPGYSWVPCIQRHQWEWQAGVCSFVPSSGHHVILHIRANVAPSFDHQVDPPSDRFPELGMLNGMLHLRGIVLLSLALVVGCPVIIQVKDLVFVWGKECTELFSQFGYPVREERVDIFQTTHHVALFLPNYHTHHVSCIVTGIQGFIILDIT